MVQKSGLLKSPKSEEQLVPDTNQGIETLEELKGFLGINNNEDPGGEEEEEEVMENCEGHELLNWDFSSSSWEVDGIFSSKEHAIMDQSCNFYDDNNNKKIDGVKSEEVDNCSGFWGESNNVMEETKTSLNLNLNYEEVLEAWSNRDSLSPYYYDHHHHPLSLSNTPYYGEVPSLEDEKTRRETSVLRYKEKRQSRLFSKKIRYEVRKLNADKRPRLKGRFVKRASDHQDA